MKLTKFSVRNFRSITKQSDIYISDDVTVLVGKNNEGKSNILKALSIAMRVLNRISVGRYPSMSMSGVYNWERDFPKNELPTEEVEIEEVEIEEVEIEEVEIEEVEIEEIEIEEKLVRKKESVFDLEFELNNEDIKLLQEEIEHRRLPDSIFSTVYSEKMLSINISITENGYATLKLGQELMITTKNSIQEELLIGNGANTRNNSGFKRRQQTMRESQRQRKIEQIITRLINRRFKFNYIPAVRTHEQAMKTIDQMISIELQLLEENTKYKKAMDRIKKLQDEALEKISKDLKKPLAEFIPNVEDVSISFTDENDSIRLNQSRQFKVSVNDGVSTDIQQKGDGVQNLATLGLLKNRTRVGEAGAMIAIEEPESHLHPGAIHQLKDIINSLGKENQVILTTHNPLFVNRGTIESNIIVENQKATPAKKISKIRDALGVKVSDNLINAEFILVVEGDSEAIALRALLPSLSSVLSEALTNERLSILPINGVGNLSYHLTLLTNMLCSYYVFLDYDDAANKAIRKVKKNRSKDLPAKFLKQTKSSTIKEAEFEDCFDLDLYEKELFKKHKIKISERKLKNRNKKWSSKMKNIYEDAGTTFDEDIEKEAKKIVVDCIVKNPQKAMSKDAHKRKMIENLVFGLENFVEANEKGKS